MNILETLSQMFDQDPRLVSDMASRLRTQNSVLFPNEEVLQSEGARPTKLFQTILGMEGLLKMKAVPMKTEVMQRLMNLDKMIGRTSPVGVKRLPYTVDLGQKVQGPARLQDLVDEAIYAGGMGAEKQEALEGLFEVIRKRKSLLK